MSVDYFVAYECREHHHGELHSVQDSSLVQEDVDLVVMGSPWYNIHRCSPVHHRRDLLQLSLGPSGDIRAARVVALCRTHRFVKEK
jgi:hypothetical protein